MSLISAVKPPRDDVAVLYTNPAVARDTPRAKQTVIVHRLQLPVCCCSIEYKSLGTHNPTVIVHQLLPVCCCSIEYKSLGKEPSQARHVASAAGSSGDSSSSQDEQPHIDTASPEDKAALDQSHEQEGDNDQPSLAFFPANHTGYIAKVRLPGGHV